MRQGKVVGGFKVDNSWNKEEERRKKEGERERGKDVKKQRQSMFHYDNSH